MPQKKPRKVRRARPLVAAPPKLKRVYGTPPGWPPGQDFRAAEAGGTIYYNDQASPWDLAHEQGHAFDEEVLSNADRWRIRKVMRIGNKGAWIAGGFAPDGSSGPDEKFADWYANAALGWGPGFVNKTKRGPMEQWNSGYATSPVSARQYRRILKIINRAALRAGLKLPPGSQDIHYR